MGKIDSSLEVLAEDAYWRVAHAFEEYVRPGFGYEDYAPAYCVGYAGRMQYGGSFADAHASLCANWERIRGDSRLSFDEALPAIRAAWERVDDRHQQRFVIRPRQAMPAQPATA
jgi:hypothetical protein